MSAVVIGTLIKPWATPSRLLQIAGTQVNWEFWTNSNDACGSSCEAQKQFIKEFRPVAKELYTQDVATFQPHYLIWVCPPQYQDTEQCTKQCIFNGRYCCPDPEGDMDKGYDGKDVILVGALICGWHPLPVVPEVSTDRLPSVHTGKPPPALCL